MLRMSGFRERWKLPKGCGIEVGSGGQGADGGRVNKCTERASQKPSKDPEASSQPGSEEGAGTQLEEAGMRGPKSRGPS